MKTILSYFIVTVLLALPASAKVSIVASSTDLASIAGDIAGDQAEITSIAQGKANLHSVEVLPSYMLKVSKADIYLKVGLGLDMWADRIIDGSRNGKLVVVDCSENIELLERPTGQVDASMGDIHPRGNPHYWLDPRNGKIIAENIFEALVKADPTNLAAYQANLEKFTAKLDSTWQEWSDRAAELKGLQVVSYHNTWPYLASAFGFKVVGFLEPKPGIEPTASHTAELIDMMKERNVRAILREPYFSDRTPNAVAKQTGANVYTTGPSVGGSDGSRDYFSLFDTLLETLTRAAGKS